MADIPKRTHANPILEPKFPASVKNEKYRVPVAMICVLAPPSANHCLSVPSKPIYFCISALIQANITNIYSKKSSCLIYLYCVISTLDMRDTITPLYIKFRELIHASLIAVGFNSSKKQ